jgi:hypothetical protein
MVQVFLCWREKTNDIFSNVAKPDSEKLSMCTPQLTLPPANSQIENANPKTELREDAQALAINIGINAAGRGAGRTVRVAVVCTDKDVLPQWKSLINNFGGRRSTLETFHRDGPLA